MTLATANSAKAEPFFGICMCCGEVNTTFMAIAFWSTLFSLPLYTSQYLVWLLFKKCSDFLSNDVILWKTQSFANLNLAMGIPSIYMCVNMNIYIKNSNQPSNCSSHFIFYYFFILLVFSLAPVLSLLIFFWRYFKALSKCQSLCLDGK